MRRTIRILPLACGAVVLAASPGYCSDLGRLVTARRADAAGTPVVRPVMSLPASVTAPRPTSRLQEPPPQFVFKFGSAGSLPGQFATPAGMDTDAQGNLYVCDRDNRRIQKFDPSGRFLMQIAPGGVLGEPLTLAHDLALDDEGNLYVAEPFDNRIRVFSPAGQLLRVFGRLYGFDSPFALDFQNGQLFVLDVQHGKVRIFDRYGQPSGGGTQPEYFDIQYPGESFGMAVSSMSDIYITSQSHCAVTKYDWAGRKQMEWGAPGTGPGEFSHMTDIAVDPSGNVYVTDRTLGRVQKFDANGGFLSMWGSNGEGDGQFSALNCITTDHLGRIYVNQLLNPRIQVFAYVVAVQPTTWSQMKAKYR